MTEHDDKGREPREPVDPDDLSLGEDFLEDLDAEIEERISAPTEEYKVPEGEKPDTGSEGEGHHTESPTPGGGGVEDEQPPADGEAEAEPVDDFEAEESVGEPFDFEAPSEEQRLPPELRGEEDLAEEEDDDEDHADADADDDEGEDDEELAPEEGHDEDEELEDEDDAEEEEEEEEEEEGDTAESEQPTVVAAAGGPPTDERPASIGGRPKQRFPMWARFTVASFLIIFSIATATASSAILELNSIASDLAHGDALEQLNNKLASVDGGAPQTILIVGSDKRPEEIEAGLNGRSDTSILLRLDPDRNALALLSIPRDLIVSIPGHGTDQFNAAYSLGGPELTLETVKALTGLEVNHLVEVNFRGFAKAVNAIGCVYVDVDRRYYHSNEGLAASAQYAEIDVRPGYQRLCGYKALEYVRFRHLDNDIVRSARQQDFLREARHRVPADKLFSDRKELIDIFTQYTTSDIANASAMLQVLKLFIEGRDAPVKEIHFEGEIGARVTTTPAQVEKAVSQFLGLEGSSGPRGNTVAPAQPVAPEEAPPSLPGASKKKTGDVPASPAAKGAKGKKAKKPSASELGLEGGSFGKKLAYRIRRRNPAFGVYYPTTVLAGSDYDQVPRAYRLQDHSLDRDQTFCYKFTLETPSGDFYGLQGTDWEDAPILDAPHEEKKIGDRTYKLYYDNDRLRMVAWEENGAAYWVSNSLLQTLTAEQMLAIAKDAKLLPPAPNAAAD